MHDKPVLISAAEAMQWLLQKVDNPLWAFVCAIPFELVGSTLYIIVKDKGICIDVGHQ